MSTPKLFISMALSAWDTVIKRTDKLFNTLTDEQLLAEIAPGRNRGVYLLGHLVAVHDGMLKFLDLGPRQHPNLDEVFLSSPDRSGKLAPSITELRKHWSDVNADLAKRMSTLTPESWFDRHTAVSAEDFAKEPHRNKLNLLINRTNHVNYHFGQLVFLQPKVAD